MSLIPRDSFFDLDKVFEGFLAPANSRVTDTRFAPRVDIKECENSYEIHADLPGVKKEDLHIHLEDGVLSLEASTADEYTEKDGEKVIRSERYSGKYMRSFSVGRNVTESDITASFMDGVLNISIPKNVEAVETRKRINVK